MGFFRKIARIYLKKQQIALFPARICNSLISHDSPSCRKKAGFLPICIKLRLPDGVCNPVRNLCWRGLTEHCGRGCKPRPADHV